MSHLEKLLAKGCQVVGGDLILRHKTMGRFRNGDFLITPDGVAELQIIDVEVAPTKAPTRRRAAVAAAPDPVPVPEEVFIDAE